MKKVCSWKEVWIHATSQDIKQGYKKENPHDFKLYDELIGWTSVILTWSCFIMAVLIQGTIPKIVLATIMISLWTLNFNH